MCLCNTNPEKKGIDFIAFSFKLYSLVDKQFKESTPISVSPRPPVQRIVLNVWIFSLCFLLKTIQHNTVQLSSVSLEGLKENDD